MPSVAELDGLSGGPAAELLRSCCGAMRWVEGMIARRPFRQMTPLLSAADEIWWSLQTSDWLEAFAHHPRIGESRGAAAQNDRAKEWSSSEQSGLAAADLAVRRQLAKANVAYDARFGYICIICAAGKSAGELLAITQSRLSNAPDVELRIAAGEQRKITRLRLGKLFHEETGAARE